MKLIIRAKSKTNDYTLNDIKINKRDNGSIDSVEIDFNKRNDGWYDLEMWLNDEQNLISDNVAVTLSKRNKMKFYKK